MSKYEYDVENNIVFDIKNKTPINPINCCGLLNELEELVEANKISAKFYKNQLAQELEEHEEFVKRTDEKISELKKENNKLKKELHKANEKVLHFQYKYFAEKQLAIDELKNIINIYEPYENDDGDVILEKNGISFLEYIDQRIKELRDKK